MTTEAMLWQPSAERIARANITEFARRAAGIAGRPLPDYPVAVALVDRGTRGVLVRAVGLRGRGGRARRAHARRPDANARRPLVSGCAPQFRGEPAHAPRCRRRRRCAGVPRRRQARAPRFARRACRERVADRGRIEGDGHQGGRPDRRLRPQHARGDRGHAGSDEPRRRVVVVLAGFRRAGRARPLRPDRAARPLHGRRLLVQRQAAAHPRPRRRCRREAAHRRARRRHSLSRSHGTRRAGSVADSQRRHLGCVPGRQGASADRVREAAVRSSAVHPVFLRHDRRAEVHRPRRRRHAAAALEGALAAQRPQGGRPAVLLHDVRLDDVELARVRPRRRRGADALRRLAVHRPRQGVVGFRRSGAVHALRHVGQVHRPREEDRRRPAQGLRARRTCGRCSRPAARSRPRASTTSTNA